MCKQDNITYDTSSQLYANYKHYILLVQSYTSIPPIRRYRFLWNVSNEALKKIKRVCVRASVCECASAVCIRAWQYDFVTLAHTLFNAIDWCNFFLRALKCLQIYLNDIICYINKYLYLHSLTTSPPPFQLTHNSQFMEGVVWCVCFGGEGAGRFWHGGGGLHSAAANVSAAHHLCDTICQSKVEKKKEEIQM